MTGDFSKQGDQGDLEIGPENVQQSSRGLLTLKDIEDINQEDATTRLAEKAATISVVPARRKSLQNQ